MDRASATKTVDSGSIPGQVKPKYKKIGTHSFPVWRSAIKGTVWSLHRVWKTDGHQAASIEDRKVPSLSPDQSTLVNKDVLQLSYYYERSVIWSKMNLPFNRFTYNI